MEFCSNLCLEVLSSDANPEAHTRALSGSLGTAGLVSESRHAAPRYPQGRRCRGRGSKWRGGSCFSALESQTLRINYDKWLPLKHSIASPFLGVSCASCWEGSGREGNLIMVARDPHTGAAKGHAVKQTRWFGGNTMTASDRRCTKESSHAIYE